MRNIYLYLLVIFMVGCADKDLKYGTESNSEMTGHSNFLTLENDRLVFSTKEQLNEVMNYYSKENDFYLDEFQSLYKQGFSPLLKVEIDMPQEDVQINHQAESTQVNGEENLDNPFEEYIADDLFASFLNDQGEIQVNDSIYKYTNRGLYFVHREDINTLYKYLDKYSKNNVGPTSSFNYDNTNLESEIHGETSRISLRIGYFINSYNENSEEITEDFNTVQSRNVVSLSNVDDLEDYVNALQPCSYKSGDLRSLFGETVVCNSYFSNRRRIKTKFYNQDYLVVKRIGVVTKYQTRRFRIWWTNRTDEMALGINQMYFQYDIPTPDYSSLNNELYFFGENVYNDQGDYIATEIGEDLPALPFDSDLEIVVKLPHFGVTNYNVSSERMNNLFWESLWQTAKAVMTSNGYSEPEKITIVGITDQKVIVDYRDFSQRKDDCHKLEKVFDSNYGFGITLGFGDGNGFSLEGISMPNLYDYEEVSADFYGVGRRGNTYKGSKIVYND